MRDPEWIQDGFQPPCAPAALSPHGQRLRSRTEGAGKVLPNGSRMENIVPI